MISHWTYRTQPWDKPYPEILRDHLYGFVYIITRITDGKLYVGKKSLHTLRRKAKHESAWRTYMGSSMDLSFDIATMSKSAFTFNIIEFSSTPKYLDYLEIKHLIGNDVLRVNSYNKAIWGPHFERGDI